MKSNIYELDAAWGSNLTWHMPATEDHQLEENLKDLYGNLRTAAMNRAYYGNRLEKLRFRIKAWEVMIALGTSSAIASWAFWKESLGEYAWLALSAVATILAILKPIFNWAKDIERYGKLFAGHGDVLFDLERLAQRASATQTFDKAARDRYDEVIVRYGKLFAEDDPSPNRKLVESCYEDVKRRYPADRFWLPPTE